MNENATRQTHLGGAIGMHPKMSKYLLNKAFSSIPTRPVAGEALIRLLMPRVEGVGTLRDAFCAASLRGSRFGMLVPPLSLIINYITSFASSYDTKYKVCMSVICWKPQRSGLFIGPASPLNTLHRYSAYMVGQVPCTFREIVVSQ